MKTKSKALLMLDGSVTVGNPAHRRWAFAGPDIKDSRPLTVSREKVKKHWKWSDAARPYAQWIVCK